MLSPGVPAEHGGRRSGRAQPGSNGYGSCRDLPSDDAGKANNPLPQDAQIKLLKAQRQFQPVQMQMSNMQRQYDQAMKDAKDLQTEMANDCAAAAKQANVDLGKFTCDLDSWRLSPEPKTRKLKKRSPRRRNSHSGATSPHI